MQDPESPSSSRRLRSDLVRRAAGLIAALQRPFRRRIDADLSDLRQEAHAAALLRALEQAAVAMGEATSRTDIYDAVGSSLLPLGYTTTILVPDTEPPYLKVVYYSAKPSLIARAEQMSGVPLSEFRVRVDAAPFHVQVMGGATVFDPDVVNLIATALPSTVGAIAKPLTSMLGMGRVVGAPLSTRADGTVDGMLVVAANNLTLSDCPAISQFARQVSARLRRESLVQRLAATNRALRVLTLASRSTSDAASEQELLQSVCDVAVKAGEYAQARAGLLRDGQLELVAWSGTSAISTDDVDAPMARALDGEIAREAGLVALPLHHEHRVVGVLELGSRATTAVSDEEVGTLLDLADAVSFGITALRNQEAREHVEGEREQLFEQLTQAQKMEVVGHVVGGVAHDFNNLLTVIVANTELAVADATEPEQREILESVMFAGQRAAALVRQLLMFSRPSASTTETLDLVALLNGLGELARRVVREDIGLSFEVPPTPVWVVGDPSQLEQVVINLVVNARDAVDRTGQIRVFLAVEDDLAVLRVTDDGVGMADEVRAKAFDPFFTTKPHSSGTGLGLATVHRLVERHGGGIDLTSSPGAGTMVTVRLPLGVAPVAEPVPVRSVRAMRRSGTVLVCEDDDSVRAIACRVLRGAGYAVVEAADGEEALELARDNDIDVLLTDLVLPGISGAELAARLRQRGPLKVLYVSGYAPEEVIGGEFPIDEAMVLPKPFSPYDLLVRLAAAPR